MQRLVTTHLCDISCDDSSLCKDIEDVDHPTWEVLATVLREIETRHGTQFDAQRLQEHRKEVGQEDDEQQGILEGCTRRNVSRIVARIDISDRDKKSRAQETDKFCQAARAVQRGLSDEILETAR